MNYTVQDPNQLIILNSMDGNRVVYHQPVPVSNTAGVGLNSVVYHQPVQGSNTVGVASNNVMYHQPVQGLNTVGVASNNVLYYQPVQGSNTVGVGSNSVVYRQPVQGLNTVGVGSNSVVYHQPVQGSNTVGVGSNSVVYNQPVQGSNTVGVRLNSVVYHQPVQGSNTVGVGSNSVVYNQPVQGSNTVEVESNSVVYNQPVQGSNTVGVGSNNAQGQSELVSGRLTPEEFTVTIPQKNLVESVFLIRSPEGKAQFVSSAAIEAVQSGYSQSTNTQVRNFSVVSDKNPEEAVGSIEQVNEPVQKSPGTEVQVEAEDESTTFKIFLNESFEEEEEDGMVPFQYQDSPLNVGGEEDVSKMESAPLKIVNTFSVYSCNMSNDIGTAETALEEQDASEESNVVKHLSQTSKSPELKRPECTEQARKLARKAFYQCCSECCTFTCVTPTEFEVHMLHVHHETKTFLCIHCGKFVDSAGGLVDHLHNHIDNQDKQFLCNYNSCSFKSEKPDHLLQHVQIHHREEDVHVCFKCGNKYDTMADLVMHLRDTFLCVVSCHYCGARDLAKKTIFKHIQESHPEKGKMVRVVTYVLCGSSKTSLEPTASLHNERSEDIDMITPFVDAEPLQKTVSGSDEYKSSENCTPLISNSFANMSDNYAKSESQDSLEGEGNGDRLADVPTAGSPGLQASCSSEEVEASNNSVDDHSPDEPSSEGPGAGKSLTISQSSSSVKSEGCESKDSLISPSNFKSKRPRRIWKCNKCAYIATYMSAIYKHLRNEHKLETPFRCSECHDIISQEEVLDHHAQFHPDADESYLPTVLTSAFKVEFVKISKTKTKSGGGKNRPNPVSVISQPNPVAPNNPVKTNKEQIKTEVEFAKEKPVIRNKSTSKVVPNSKKKKKRRTSWLSYSKPKRKPSSKSEKNVKRKTSLSDLDHPVAKRIKTELGTESEVSKHVDSFIKSENVKVEMSDAAGEGSDKPQINDSVQSEGTCKTQTIMETDGKMISSKNTISPKTKSMVKTCSGKKAPPGKMTSPKNQTRQRRQHNIDFELLDSGPNLNFSSEVNFEDPNYEFRCKYCTFRIDSLFKFLHHLYYHFHYRVYACGFCDHKGFGQNSVLTHIQSEHPKLYHTPIIKRAENPQKEVRCQQISISCFTHKSIEDTRLKERLERKKQRLMGKGMLKTETKASKTATKKIKASKQLNPKKSAIKKDNSAPGKFPNKKVKSGESGTYLCPYCRHNRPKLTWPRLVIEICYHIHYKPFQCGLCHYPSSSSTYIGTHIQKTHPGQDVKMEEMRIPVKEMRLKTLLQRSLNLSKKLGTQGSCSSIVTKKRLPIGKQRPAAQKQSKINFLQKVEEKVGSGASEICQAEANSNKDADDISSRSGAGTDGSLVTSGESVCTKVVPVAEQCGQSYKVVLDNYGDSIYECLKCNFTNRNKQCVKKHLCKPPSP